MCLKSICFSDPFSLSCLQRCLATYWVILKANVTQQCFAVYVCHFTVLMLNESSVRPVLMALSTLQSVTNGWRHTGMPTKRWVFLSICGQDFCVCVPPPPTPVSPYCILSIRTHQYSSSFFRRKTCLPWKVFIFPEPNINHEWIIVENIPNWCKCMSARGLEIDSRNLTCCRPRALRTGSCWR